MTESLIAEQKNRQNYEEVLSGKKCYLSADKWLVLLALPTLHNLHGEMVYLCTVKLYKLELLQLLSDLN